MKSFSSSLWLYVVAIQVLMLSGCATNSYHLMQQTEQQSKDQAVIAQVSQAIQQLESRVAQAQADNVATFSPRHMDEALSALDDARGYYERFQLEPDNVSKPISLFFGETMGEKTMKLIARANQALNQAEENKRVADQLFAESNENFKWLTKFQAPLYYPYEYEDIVSAHKRLVNAVADGRIDRARQRLPQLMREQRALEVVSAQQYYLQGVSQRIEREGRYELDRYANLTYSKALGTLNQAKAIIAKNPRDEAAILQAKAQAVFALEVAHAVARDMQKLVNMDRQEMERWLMLLTERLHEAGVALGIQDIRNQSIAAQVEQISQAAKQQPAPLVNDDEALAEQQVESEQKENAVAAAPHAAPENAQQAAEAEAPAEQAKPNLANRVANLEQSLSQQIEALSAQIKAMKATQQQASTPVYDAYEAADSYESESDYVPLSERKSLFFY